MYGVTLTDGVVTLKPLVEGDASVWLAGEDEEQLKWFEAPRPAQLSDVDRFIASCQESWRTMGSHRHWGIRRVNSEPLIGGVDVRLLENGDVNLSYVVFPDFRRRGFARRASVQALDYASTEMGSTTAVIKMLPENVSSKNLALCLGATYFGQAPSDAGKIFEVYKLAIPVAYLATPLV